jgi:hypothetical protein
MKNVGGQLLMFMQVLGAIQSAQIEFGDPFMTFMASITEPVSMQFVFAAIPCLQSGFEDPVAVFAAKLFVPVVFLMLVTVCYFIINTIRPRFLMRDGLLNVFGETLIEFYVSLTLGVLSPFRCYNHPNGDDKSMIDSPDILCYNDSSHDSLIILSIIGMLMYTISTLAVTYFGVWYHPRAMAKNDIFLLVRCHFIFARWNPKAYWFAAIAVTRNALVAIWPMMVPDFGVALSLMFVTLCIPFAALAAVMPRRTPAMNALDVHMSFVQCLIIVCGPMMLLSDGGKSVFLSALMMIFVISVFIIAAVLVGIKGFQWLCTHLCKDFDAPGFWNFDVFLDHHAGPGGCSARALHLLLLGTFRKGKFFYDVDSYMRNHNIGVVMDAAKLSKHICICLGSETWSRHWCVAAICSACQWKVEMSVVDLDDTTAMDNAASARKSLPSLHSVTRPEADIDEICEVLSKKVARDLLRPYGLGDSSIPQAMKSVFMCKPSVFAMRDKASTDLAVKNLLTKMQSVALVGPQQASTNFFSPDDLTVVNSAMCLSCDHADPDAVCVSRLLGYLLKEGMAEVAKMASVSTARADGVSMNANAFDAIKKQIANLKVVQDIDLDPTAFASMVKGGKFPVVVPIITGGSFQSTPQLLRMGFHQQYNSEGFRPHPIAICEIFTMPDAKAVNDIEQGRVLALGANAKDVIKAFLTEHVSFARVALALIQVLEARVFLCNCNVATELQIKETLIRQLIKVAESMTIPAKPAPAEPAPAEDDLKMSTAPTQQSRYMSSYMKQEGIFDSSQPEMAEEMLV